MRDSPGEINGIWDQMSQMRVMGRLMITDNGQVVSSERAKPSLAETKRVPKAKRNSKKWRKR